MRCSIGLGFVLVPLSLGLGACAEDEGAGPYLPQLPQIPDVAENDEPALDTLTRHSHPPRRPDSADRIIDDATADRAFALGRATRARYDQLRAAELLRRDRLRDDIPTARLDRDECTVINVGPGGVDDGRVGICHEYDGSYEYLRVSPDACREAHAHHALDFRSDDPLCRILPVSVASNQPALDRVR